MGQEQYKVWRPITGDDANADGIPDGKEKTLVEAGEKIWLISITTNLVAAQLRIGNGFIMNVPAGQTLTIGGSDTPDFFWQPTEVEITLFANPVALTGPEAFMIYGHNANNSMARIARIADAFCRKFGLTA